MTGSSHRALHGDAYREWRDERAGEFAEAQHRAFLAGFEAAAAEGAEFRHLREWLEEQRDEASERVDAADGDDRMMSVRSQTFSEVLVKLSEMGCRAEDDPREVVDDD